MLEQKIDELILAVKGLTSAMLDKTKEVDTYVPIDLGVTVPDIVTEPPVVVKKKKSYRKKKVNSVDEIQTYDKDAEELPETPQPNTVTLENLISEVRKNVIAQGDDVFAVSVIDEYQKGATLKTLKEENYAPIYAKIVGANQQAEATS